MTDEINKDLKNWGIKFNIDINPVKPDDIVKNPYCHTILKMIILMVKKKQ